MSNGKTASSFGKSKIIFAGALALPVVGLAGVWANTQYESEQGVDWIVPIRGYDPRDLLRGHYVQYRYDWPGLNGDEDLTGNVGLCIAGRAPKIDEVKILKSNEFHSTNASCSAIARVNLWSEEGTFSLSRDRIYLSQQAAAAADEKLGDQRNRSFVKVRINKSGKIRPLTMEFRPLLEGEKPAMQISDRFDLIQVAEPEISGSDE